jgi:hypothetical protein
LPPSGSAAGQIVTPPPSSTTQSFFPKPGGNQIWEEQHYQPKAGYDADAVQHPYSTSIGPKPGAHSSGQDVHYKTTDEDAAPSRHPYTAPGVGWPQTRRLRSAPRIRNGERRPVSRTAGSLIVRGRQGFAAST